MNRAAWFLIETVSAALEPDEREAVLGDALEAEASAWRALIEVAGLVGRRHASYWCDWRPWFVVLGLAAPLGFLLSHAARWWADSSAIGLLMYIDGWTSGYLASPGARRDLFVETTTILAHSVTLVGLSWTGGIVLSSLSRRVLGLTATLFVVVVLAGTVGTATTARAFGGNVGVFAVPFYGFAFPWLLKTALVLLPACLGMRRGLRPVPLQLPPALVIAMVVTTLLLWTGRGLQASLIFGRGTMPNPGLDGIIGTADDVWPLRWLPLLATWPAIYLALATAYRSWRTSTLHG